MSLFECSGCGCIENTALCNYHVRRYHHDDYDQHPEKYPPLCSECDPEIGEWHGQFEKRSAVGMQIDQDGHLWSKEQINAGYLPGHFRIVGEVKQPDA